LCGRPKRSRLLRRRARRRIPSTALFRIDIIKVPLAHPEKAAIVNSPRIFADAKPGAPNGLWKGGAHGEGSQSTSVTDKCHDITVYSAKLLRMLFVRVIFFPDAHISGQMCS
jgi:hypothetical protein